MRWSPPDAVRRRPLLAGSLAALVAVPVAVGSCSGDDDAGPAPTASTPRSAPPPDTAERDRYDDGAAWPVYGGNDQRTRYRPFSGRRPIRPPFRERWAATGSVLLEFPPVLCGDRLYVLRYDGQLRAVDRRTGRVAWRKRIGSLAASSPACGNGRLYATVLRRNPRVNAGRIVALTTHNGRRVWSKRLGSRAESSPLLTPGLVIFGTEAGQVLALRRRTGRVVWRYRAAGPVKAAVARNGGSLFVGDYAGRMHAIWLRTGRRRWTAEVGGRLYATPSVAYGRVFVGSVDGAVVALRERTGRLAWRRRTSGYVYSAAAVAPVKGHGPTVFVGSYGKILYALSVRTGRARWFVRTGGRIAGGVTVVGDLVLYANLGRRTVGIRRAGDGRLLHAFGSGAFDPGISDGRRLYLDSYTSIYHLVPRRQARLDARSLRRAGRDGP